MYGREPRGDQLSRWNIIESDHRKILWNAQLMAPGSLYHTNGQPIAGCQDGRANESPCFSDRSWAYLRGGAAQDS